MVAWAGAGVGIGAILPLQFRVQLFIQYSYFHFMLHCLGLLLGKWQFSSPAMEPVPQFFSYINRREKKTAMVSHGGNNALFNGNEVFLRQLLLRRFGHRDAQNAILKLGG